MIMSDQTSHQPKSYDVGVVAESLRELHEYVTRGNARIEITRPGSNERCVLLSKQELDSLERALAILADTADVKELSEKIAHLAALASAGDFCHA
jgi:PHD/YefM family antitoxin component YafN of YafNO toxin-antitoxin module